MASHPPRPPLAPAAHGGSNGNGNDSADVGQARRLRSLFTPWKGGGGGGGGGGATGATTTGAANANAAPPPPPTPVALRSWRLSDHPPQTNQPPPPPPPITLTLAQQHLLPGGRGRALAFDLASGGSPALYAGDGPASLKKLSLLSPNAPLALRLPPHSRGARAVAPPAHPGCRHLAGVATAGAGLVMVSGETGNTVVSVPFLAGGGGVGVSGGPAPGTSASTWSVAWSPLRPTHELLVGLDGGRVATVDLRCASSSSSSSSSPSPSSSAAAAGRAVLSVVRVGGGAASSSSSTTVGPPIHTLVPLPPGCEAALVGGEALACSGAGAFALWRPPGLGPQPLAAPQLTPALPRGASIESASVSPDGKTLAVSVRRRSDGEGGGGGGAEVWVFGLAGEGEEDEGEGRCFTATTPLRLGGHVSAAHMTAGALVPFGVGGGRNELLYATGDEARRAPVAWRFAASSSPSLAAPLTPSLSPSSLHAPFPSPVLAVAGARVPGLLGAGAAAVAPLLLAAASAGCVRVYQVGEEEEEL